MRALVAISLHLWKASYRLTLRGNAQLQANTSGTRQLTKLESLEHGSRHRGLGIDVGRLGPRPQVPPDDTDAGALLPIERNEVERQLVRDPRVTQLQVRRVVDPALLDGAEGVIVILARHLCAVRCAADAVDARNDEAGLATIERRREGPGVGTPQVGRAEDVAAEARVHVRRELELPVPYRARDPHGPIRLPCAEIRRRGDVRQREAVLEDERSGAVAKVLRTRDDSDRAPFPRYQRRAPHRRPERNFRNSFGQLLDLVGVMREQRGEIQRHSVEFAQAVPVERTLQSGVRDLGGPRERWLRRGTTSYEDVARLLAVPSEIE